MKEKELFQELSTLVTEQRNQASMEIDIMDTESIVRLINNEDKTVANIVEQEIPYIVEAIEIITKAFKNGGRLIYAGAGTSGPRPPSGGCVSRSGRRPPRRCGREGPTVPG